MDEKDETPAGQPAPNPVAAAKAESQPQNQAARTYTAAEYEKAVAEALTKAGNDARSVGALKAALAAEKEAFDKQKTEWETKLTGAKAVIFNADVLSIAGKHGIDARALKDKVSELGLTELPKVESLAAVMPKDQIKNDSGRSVGGDDFWKLTPEEKYRRGVEEERARGR